MSSADPLDGLDGVELGPAAAQCTKLERRFAFALALGLADTQAGAARLAGYSSKGGGERVSAARAMAKDHVRAAVREFAGTELLGLVGLALKAQRELLLDKKHPQHERAVSSVLNRVGFGERAAVDVNVSGGITVQDHDKAAVEDLRKCIELGLSEEKLIEAFGYSGLGRYRRMIAEEDAKLAQRGVKMIEGTAVEIALGAIDEPKRSPLAS
jgi:hypothetical protein